MGRSEVTKERILAVERMFQTGVVLTTDKIMHELEAKYGITVDRKTIYSDIKAIDKYIPIVTVRHGAYQLQSAFKETHVDMVDTSLCLSCYFYRNAGQEKTCDYILITGKKRPCPPGKDCTEYRKCSRSGRKENKDHG